MVCGYFDVCVIIQSLSSVSTIFWQSEFWMNVLENFIQFFIFSIQVWASGFSAAFLKKHSVATKGTICSNESGMKVLVGSKEVVEPKPAVTEAALLLVLEKFFEVVLSLPKVNRQLIIY